MNARAKRWILIAILSAAAVVYLLGNATVQLWDRDEPRYAQTSRQMLQSGDWVVPRFLDTVRTAKPIFIYWCQASAMSVFGDNAFAARLPSVVAMVLTLGLLAGALWGESGPNRTLWTIFIFATTGLAIMSAKMSLTDSVLLLFVIAGQLCIYRLWRYGLCLWTIILLGVCIGLAGLTKGPVAVGVHVMTILALAIFSRLMPMRDQGRFEFRHLPIIVGIVIAMVFVVVFPWLYLIQERAPDFLSSSIQHDVIDRARSGHEGHSWPPGYYTLAVWGTFFPWSLLIPAALVNAWRQRHLPATRFALAAFIGPWIMFELIAGKLPHYVLPTYPALAYLVADMLVRAARGSFADLRRKDFIFVTWIWAIMVTGLGCGAWAGLFVAKQYDLLSMFIASVILLIAAMMGLGTAMRFTRGRVFAAARAMGLGMMLLIAVAYTFYFSRYRPLRLSIEIATIMRQAGAPVGVMGYMIDYKEPSLAFHQGGGLREQREDDYLNTSDPNGWPEWIVLTDRVWKNVRQDVRQKWQIVGSASGLAYNDGGQREIFVIKRL